MLAAVLPVGAMAQTTTAPVNVNVTASVSAVCNLSATTTDIAFGAIPAFTASAVNASGSVSLTCNRGAVVTMAVGNGLNYGLGLSGTARAMASGSDYISYQIFQPNISGTTTNCTGASTAWGSGGAAFTATGLYSGSGGPRTILLCGQVAAAPLDGYAAGATYADTVAVTATY
jgi:spore coat protein U-like protein